jgi:hypothetical protein
LPCVSTPGSTRGTCGGVVPPPPMDGGNVVGDGAVPPEDGQPPPPYDAAPPPPYDGGPAGCADFGQICTMNSDCCNQVPCAGGRCGFVN